MRDALGKAAVPLLAVAAAVIGLAYYNLSEADEHITSAVRSFSPCTAAPCIVEPGGELEVSIAAAGLGGFGWVFETLPEGFTYLGSDIDAGFVTEGQNADGLTVVSFTIIEAEKSFTYRLTAPTAGGTYTFSGRVEDFLLNSRSVGGATEVFVDAPAPTATPTPTVTPTPTATATATATTVIVPTATYTATPTSTTVTIPTATSTPTATPTATATTEATPEATAVATPTTEATPDATPIATPTTVPTPVPTATQTPIPQPSSGIGITVSSGGAHYCALHGRNGSILCWGENEQGQASPPRTGRYTAIVSGETHSCALRTDGAVVCWGSIVVGR